MRPVLRPRDGQNEGRGQLKRCFASKKGEKTARTGELIVTVDGWTDGKGTVGQRSQ